MIERATMDNAVKRALQFEAIKIIAEHSKLIPTSFVIIRCLKTGLLWFCLNVVGLLWRLEIDIVCPNPKSDVDPFMLAEVCSVHPEERNLKVHWWTPTSLSRQKQQCFHSMVFAPEMDKLQVKNRIRGAPIWRLSPKIQTIQFNMVYFGFNKSTSRSSTKTERYWINRKGN